MSYANQKLRNQQEDLEEEDEEINDLLKNEDEDIGTHDDIDDDDNNNCNLKKYTKRKRRIRNGILSCHSLVIAITIPMLILLLVFIIKMFNHHGYSNDDFTLSNKFPNELLPITKNQIIQKGEGVYSLSDFQNDISIIPYWEDILSAYKVPIEASLYVIDDDDDKKNEAFNDEKYGSFLTSQNNDDDNETDNENDNNITYSNEVSQQEHVIPHIGPCYLPLLQQDMDSIDWQSLINKNYNSPHSQRNITFPLPYILHKHHNTFHQEEQTNLENYCRPGFIIIGAGKCGTSSLYHYLVGHNRVVPSKQKQIHYFKYFPNRPMSWYLSHFYSTEDFLSSGALMTGEASPGYLVSGFYFRHSCAAFIDDDSFSY